MKCKYFLFVLFLTVNYSVFSQVKTISNITIKGLKKTKKTTITKLLQTKVGAPLDSLEIENDVTFLKRLPAVSHAYYQVFHSHESSYNVFITIEENFTILPESSVWETIENRFSYKLGLYDYNFLGRNIAFGGFYQNNGFDSYGVNFKAPNLFSKKWGLAINHQNWKSEEPLYFADKTANFLYNNISYEVLGLYQINLKNEINFGINVFKEKFQFLSGDTDPSIPLIPIDLDKILFKLVYKYNNLDYYYQYVNGIKSELYVQYVATENNFQNEFVIAWNDFSYFKRIKNKGNWANRLRFGLASNDNSPFAPFALDNNINIRGVGFLVDRGTGVAVFNTEYRHTIYDKKGFAIQTNTFLDAGSWRDPGGKLNEFFMQEKLRVYSGVGLRFISKKIYNATFRIDYGFTVKDKQSNATGGLVFGVGQYF